MVTDAVQDAAAVLPVSTPDTTGMQNLAVGEYRRTVKEVMPRDHVRMYHPDGTTSIILIPPLGKNGRNARERQQTILHYIMNKRGPHGEQWWYASPDAVPGGWKPGPLPLRCFVHGCTRAGGLPNWTALYRHIQGKHHDDMEMYKTIIKQIETRIENDVDPAVMASLGLSDETQLTPEVITGLQLPDTPDTTDATGAPRGQFDCPHCDWQQRKYVKRPQLALAMHLRGVHKGGT